MAAVNSVTFRASLGRSLGFCLLTPDGKRGGSACYDALCLRRIAAEIADQLSEDVSITTC